MKEVTFVNRNRKRWIEFENKLNRSDQLSPDEIGDIYVHVTDDLSFARCYFPDSKTTEFLNGLAARFHRVLYTSKRLDKKSFRDFWLHDLPEVMYRSRKTLLLSFVIFVVAFTAGVFSSFEDESYIRAVLGDHYVNMTLENIRNNDPMGVYKSGGAMESFIYILFNNIKVSIITYVFGLIIGMGAMAVVFNNGTMIGAFISLFMIYGGFHESMLTVWMHGAIEVCTLIISGCAGILMGSGLLFPGTYTRRQSFLKTARDSSRIMMGVIPFIAIAAFIEGFVTRHTEWPDALRASFIALSLFFMIFYFALYPYLRFRNKTTDGIEKWY